MKINILENRLTILVIINRHYRVTTLILCSYIFLIFEVNM